MVSMIYAVTAKVTFDTKAHATQAYNLLTDRWSFIHARPENVPPTLSEDGLTLTFYARFTSQAVRKAVYDWLDSHRTWIKANTSGYLAYHLCRHDEGRPCEDEKRITWGEQSE